MRRTHGFCNPCVYGLARIPRAVLRTEHDHLSMFDIWMILDCTREPERAHVRCLFIDKHNDLLLVAGRLPLQQFQRLGSAANSCVLNSPRSEVLGDDLTTRQTVVDHDRPNSVEA